MPKQSKNSTTKTSLSSFELILMGAGLILFIGFVLIGGEDQEIESSEASNQSELSYYQSDSLATKKSDKATIPLSVTSIDTITESIPKSEMNEPYPLLFVCIDSMKMRSDHSLQSEQICVLRLGQKVSNLGEYSVVERIKISSDRTEVAPWIKVKTPDGKIGWVFGAGLTFYPTQ